MFRQAFKRAFFFATNPQRQIREQKLKKLLE